MLRVFSLGLALAMIAAAQNATISGIVSDSTGAVVAEVAVHAVNTATGERTSAASSADGNYVLPLLKPGSYRVEAEKTGFKRYQATGIVLETGTPARLDITLEVGAVAESVTVEASAPLLQSETAAVGAVIENRTIANMPLIDRRAAQLVRLTGFVTGNGSAGLVS